MIFVDAHLVMRMTNKRYINVKTPRVMPWSREAPVPLPRKKGEVHCYNAVLFNQSCAELRGSSKSFQGCLKMIKLVLFLDLPNVH